MNVLRFIYEASARAGSCPGKPALWYVYVKDLAPCEAQERVESYIENRGWIPARRLEICCLSSSIPPQNLLDYPMAARACKDGICGECYSEEDLELLAG